MADEKEGSDMSAGQVFLIFLLCLAGLVGVWYYTGGPEKADLGGLFLAPPPPIGSGEAYGPEFYQPQEVSPTVVE